MQHLIDQPLQSARVSLADANVARLYVVFARDLEADTHVVPDFSHAVARHRLIDRIREASRGAALR
jgi:hypothetical protein